MKILENTICILKGNVLKLFWMAYDTFESFQSTFHFHDIPILSHVFIKIAKC